MKHLTITAAALIVLLAAPGVTAFLPAQERVEEKVDVRWWVIPLFAVDKSGNSVTDLEAEDIKLMLDKQQVKEFVLYKKSFSVSEKTGQQEQKKPQPQPPPEEREKMIFLLFDTTLSSRDAMSRAREIAREIVLKGETDNHFVVMGINPNAGLLYVGGPLNDKKLVLNLLTEKLDIFDGEKGATSEYILKEIIEGGAHGGKYSGAEVRSFLIPHLNRPLKRRNLVFFKSFQTLYYAINTLKCNKFVYLFSEGIGKNTMYGDKISTYHKYLEQMAQHLSSSGAVLFIVNPSGAIISNFSGYSGEDSLRYLAEESGGKYLEGTQAKIVKRIENMHRAYYEIGFSDLPEAKENLRRVTIKSNRRGVKIHTLRSVKEEHSYAQMKDIEKEMLALNLAARNRLFNIAFPARDIQVDKIEKTAESNIYHVILPESFLGHESDLFNIRVDRDSSSLEIEKQALTPRKARLSLEIKNAAGKESHFVIIDGSTNSALVGCFDYLKEKKTK